MKKLLVAVVFACGFAAFAKEWYVDPVNGNDAYDGTTSNVVSDTVGPRRTLVGIMELVGNDDTIWMLPGDYAEKSVLDSRGADHRRLDIVDKSGLKFRSVAGREKTAIVGQHDGTNGCDGPNAVGGVMLSGSSANCVFEGITFRDCAAANGGGSRDLTKLCWFIGCSFTNCIASVGGAMVQGNASGTEFVDCSGTNSTMNSMIGYGLGTMEFCLFRHINGTGRYLFQNGGTFINCTAYGMAPVYSGPARFYNSLIFGAGNNGAYGAELMWATNSWLGVAKYVNVGENAQTNVNEWVVRFVSPAMGDFRLTDISEVTELGDASYLALSPFPEGFVRKDVYGNPVTVTEGPIPAGCALEVMHQTGGRVGFSSGFEVKELGCKVASGDYVNPITEDYTYMIRPTTADHTFWVSRGTDRYFPLRQKGGWVPIGTNKDPYSTNNFAVTPCGSSYIYYADPVNGNDDYDGKSSNVVDAAANKGPFRTLMGAMTKMNANNKNKILYLLPGIYAEGQSEGRPVADGIRYRVYGNKDCCRLIVGLEGPEKTFIVGAPDPDKPDGLGTNAIGGVWFASGGGGVQGVTITGCYSSDTKNTGYQYAGCAFAGGGSTSTMCFDCIISNNTAYCAPVKSYGTMSRCRILNNHSTIYLCTKGDPVSSSVFAGNEITSTTAKYKYFSDGSTYGCTFDAKVSGTLGANTYYSLVLNRDSSGNLNQSCCDPIPLVADPDSFDYRLGSLSPAVLFGDVSARGANASQFIVCDVDGNKLEIKDGKMTVGAVHSGPRVPCVAITGSNGGSVTVVGGEYGTNLVTSTDPITVTASTTRPFLHFEKNGEQVTPIGQMSYTFSPSDELDAATVVKVVYGTNWYVNASAVSDEGLGSTPETARQTIRSATANAIAGDVIHVAPGEYGAVEGSELQASVQTRVVVPANVRLQGEGARYAAVIRGAAASEPEDDYTNGVDAVRCVYLSAGATIANFTLTDGHTTTNGYGSAVYAANNTTAMVVDCLVSNNFGYVATLESGRIVRCRVVNNKATERSCLGEGGRYYGCFFDKSYSRIRPLYQPVSLDFCTLGSGNRVASGSQIIGPPSKMVMRNSVMVYGVIYQPSKVWATNCVFASVAPADLGGSSNCVKMTVANMKLSDDGVPAADSLLNNAGSVELFPDCVNETDLAGVPRVLNGGVDAGAYEHDWRVEYKYDLGPRATAVTEASPEVVETEDGKVRIPSGTLEGKLKLSGGAVRLNFKVQGGTLEVYLGEKRVGEFGAADVGQSVELWPEEGNDAFRLVFTPSAADGYAEIDRLTKGTSGIIFMVR